MQLTVTGKQVDVGGALRRHVEDSLDALLGKYFRTAIEAHAVFAREAHLIRTDLSLHIGRGIMIKSGATASDSGDSSGGVWAGSSAGGALSPAWSSGRSSSVITFRSPAVRASAPRADGRARRTPSAW